MSLAVKYRPKDFNEVMGQDLIKDIISNQIENNDLSTGYLFSGGSGIGKTTIARILANKVNAEIIEIDGASNNSVDDVRRIRDNVKYKSLNNEYKIYIIDECHMLSKSAFNALLKTLEEPPANVIFILCTTEPEKIPPTIHTRVQQFEFKLVPINDVKERLQYIANKEHIAISDEVLLYIAKISEGGMRNAISILDKCRDLTNVDLEDVIELSGGVNYESMMELLQHIINKDQSKVVGVIEKLHQDGKNLKLFIKKFTEFTVDLTKFAMKRDNDLIFNYINIPINYKEQLNTLIDNLLESDLKLGSLFDKFNNIHNNIRYEKDPKLLIEGALMLLC